MPVETPSLFAQVIRDHLESEGTELGPRPADADRPLQVRRSVREPPAVQDRGAGAPGGDDGRRRSGLRRAQRRREPALARRGDRGDRTSPPPQARSRTPASGPSIAPATSTGATEFSAARAPCTTAFSGGGPGTPALCAPPSCRRIGLSLDSGEARRDCRDSAAIACCVRGWLCGRPTTSPAHAGEIAIAPAAPELVESYRRLADVFHEVLAEQSLDALLVRIADALADLIPHDTLTIYEADEAQAAADARARPRRVRGRDHARRTLRFDEGITGWAAQPARGRSREPGAPRPARPLRARARRSTPRRSSRSR